MCRRNLVAFCLLAVMASCSGGSSHVDAGPLVVETIGDGTIHRNGQTRSYVVAGDRSRLLLLVKRKTDIGCSGGHAHAVASLANAWTFALDADSPTGSTLSATMQTSGMDPDRDEYRAEFPETSSVSVSAFRDEIRGSVMGQLDPSSFPTLVFSASNLSTLDGSGTADVQVQLRGATSNTHIDAQAQWNGDELTITGSGPLDGNPHGVPNGSLGACLRPDMTMKLTLVLVPGGRDAGP